MSDTDARPQPGVPPLTRDQLRHRHGAAVGALPNDARQAMSWLRRGGLATSPILPLALRRALLRLGGVKLGAMIWGLDRCWFQSPQITIGTGSYVNAGCWFEGVGRITLGDNCLLGPQVMILTSTHAVGDSGEVARAVQSRNVRVGDGCWIGARATIMPGVTIGAGTLIAAAAVVTKDCEAGTVYAGVPARRLK
jgi:maltose O-acetyltransferase